MASLHLTQVQSALAVQLLQQQPPANKSGNTKAARLTVPPCSIECNCSPHMPQQLIQDTQYPTCLSSRHRVVLQHSMLQKTEHITQSSCSFPCHGHLTRLQTQTHHTAQHTTTKAELEPSLPLVEAQGNHAAQLAHNQANKPLDARPARPTASH